MSRLQFTSQTPPLPAQPLAHGSQALASARGCLPLAQSAHAPRLPAWRAGHLAQAASCAAESPAADLPRRKGRVPSAQATQAVLHAPDQDQSHRGSGGGHSQQTWPAEFVFVFSS